MNTKLQKKYKVIDSVFFTDEIDYLLFRFTELNDFVDMFIVCETILEQNNAKVESVFKKNSDKFNKWKNKIVHIQHSVTDYIDIEKIKFEFLFKELSNLKFGFDDIVLISKIDEFPELEFVDTFKSHLTFEPIILYQKDFIWSKDYIKKERHLGTICVQYSSIVLDPNIINLIINYNLRNVRQNFSLLNFGYRFSLFYDLDKAIQKLCENVESDKIDKITQLVKDSQENLVYYDMSTLSNPKSLKKYNGNLPKNIDMLNSQKIGRNTIKKHLVVFSMDSLFNLSEDYESISLVKPSDKLTSKDIHSDLNVYYIQMPTKKYYDILIDENTFENFKKMYLLNETKKILYDKFPVDDDVFVFYYKGKQISLKWSEIENEFLYDLLEVK